VIKVLNQYFPRRWAVLLVGESLVILLALTTALALQSGGGFPAVMPPLPVEMKALLITLVCQVCLHYSDLYEPNSGAAGRELLTRLLQALGIASLALALIYWLLPELRLSTGMVVGSVVALVVLLLVWRRAMDAAAAWLRQAYPGGERLLVLGSGQRAAELLQELRLRPQLGLAPVGLVRDGDGEDGEMRDGVPVVGRLDELDRLLETYRPQRIVIALQERRSQLPLARLMAARAAGVQIEEAPTLFERITGRVALDSVLPSWLILSEGFRQPRWFNVYQRVTSGLGAALGLVVLSPVMLLTAVAIKLDSRGPAIYKQERVGLNGRTFNILKFRSMRVDAENGTGPVWARERDPRVTRVGHWLRKLRLDELPQLFNVLRGEMRIVGPRPERPVFVEGFRKVIPYYEMRHSVPPGITGWAQVNRDYGASLDDAREKLEFDLFYIKNLSIWLDLFILFQTTKIMFLGRGAR
jgi:sugar transferase (PEP-CTERM system associated)